MSEEENKIVETSPVKIPAQQPTDNASALMSVISSAATNPDVDVEKMERLFAMHEKIVAKSSEEAFNAAMSRAQAKMGRVSADATNPQTRSNYASYAALDRVLRPIYTDEGFALSFGTADTTLENYVRVVCYVSHTAGHSRSYHADMPADGLGAKGGAVMTKTHAAGAAMSYGMRYLLKLIFNVAIGEDDNDGNVPRETISDEQYNTLHSMILDGGVEEKDIPRWLNKLAKGYGVESAQDIPAKQFSDAVKIIKQALKPKKDKAGE